MRRPLDLKVIVHSMDHPSDRRQSQIDPGQGESPVAMGHDKAERVDKGCFSIFLVMVLVA